MSGVPETKKPPDSTSRRPRVLLKTPVAPNTGYGQDGIGLTEALVKAGCSVSLHPYGLTPPIPQTVADLLTEPIGGHYDILIHHAPPAQLSLSPVTALTVGKSVGWSMWETTSFDNMPENESEGITEHWEHFDLMLAYDEVSAQAFQPHVSDNTVLDILQGGYSPEGINYTERPDTKAFRFCMVGALHERKNPMTALLAFRDLKEKYPKDFEHAELYLKTVCGGIEPAFVNSIPKAKLVVGGWPHKAVIDFMSGCHVLLAPSRGEGKNIPALEMMTTGGTVLATDWGGHRQWLNTDYAYPLEYDLIPVSDKYPDCVQAEVSRVHLMEMMLHVYRNPDEVRNKGKLASEIIPELCSWDTVLDRLLQHPEII